MAIILPSDGYPFVVTTRSKRYVWGRNLFGQKKRMTFDRNSTTLESVLNTVTQLIVNGLL